MCERFVRIGVEIPLSLYANLDKIKNGSAATGRILDAIKKEKTEMEKARTEYDFWRATKTYKNSIYGEMKENNNEQRLIDAEALKAELTCRIALPDWVLTAVLHIIENTPTVPTVMGKANFDYCPHCGAKMEVK